MIGVLGSTGFLGRNLVSVLRANNINHVCGSRRLKGDEHVDAIDIHSINGWIYKNEITKIINCAAECGGIGLNQKNPFGLWWKNNLINTNVLMSSVSSRIKKLIMLGTVCSYSKNTPVPFKEDYLMSYGFPEETNAAYGLAKLNALFGAKAAHDQYGLNVMNLIPVNMYGPYDHFDLEKSHVIPAIIKKIDDAIINNSKEITLWGDGSASREFLHATDCSEAILKALEYDKECTDFINIGVGQETTIFNLATIISEIMGYDGKILWNKNQPNGQPRRCLDVSKITEVLGWKSRINLRDGLSETIEWYKQNRTKS
jgi:GDP-L-fucose synthase